MKDLKLPYSESLWDRIEENLPQNKKKKKTRIIWLLPIGVAASLVLLLILKQEPSQNNDINRITVTPYHEEELCPDDVESNYVLDTENDTEQLDSSSQVNEFKGISNKNNFNANPIVVTQQDQKSKTESNSVIATGKDIAPKESLNPTKIVQGITKESFLEADELIGVSTKDQKLKTESNPVIATVKEIAPKESSNPTKIVQGITKESFLEADKLIGVSTKDQKSKTESNPVIAIVNEIAPKESSNPTKIVQGITKEPFLEADRLIGWATKDQKSKIGSNPVIATGKEIVTEKPLNPIEIAQDINKDPFLEAIEEGAEDNNNNKKKEKNRWTLLPQVAPLAYNSISKGSQINSNFSNKPQSSKSDISYGIKISYKIANNIEIRSGLSTVNVNLYTKELSNSELFKLGNAIAINIESNPDGGIEDPGGGIGLSNLPILQTEGPRSLQQQINYIEIPVELAYKIIDKKIGVSIIGGISTFILNADKNKVFIATELGKSQIGSTNNVNTASFSGNIGLGVDYYITKRVQINIEPIFKYQPNAFENNTSFQPYIFGVYSGIKFKL
ncbi:porin family protein [Flavivirga eckloniae]|uniref:outer membrane beta-barrel protein n=1 Tax=Flavivirga eckloniae TaxID=1803846 RepID=UPI00131578E8|nr:outer membrane beta-barrel protein [Flavivirga eckloniae]